MIVSIDDEKNKQFKLNLNKKPKKLKKIPKNKLATNGIPRKVHLFLHCIALPTALSAGAALFAYCDLLCPSNCPQLSLQSVLFFFI